MSAARDMFEIESGVELPKRSYSSASWKYPIDALEVGQSFLVPFDVFALDKNGNALKLSTVASRLRGAVGGAKKRHVGAKYAVREVEGGVRVWRKA